MNRIELDGDGMLLATTMIIPVYAIYIAAALSLAVFAAVIAFAIRSRVAKHKAKQKVKRDFTAAAAVQREKKEQKKKQSERVELESMLPPSWLKAYDVCENLDDREIRLIWLEAFLDRARRAQNSSMPYLSIEAAMKFAVMITGFSGGRSFSRVLRMLRPYFQLEATSTCSENCSCRKTSPWHAMSNTPTIASPLD